LATSSKIIIEEFSLIRPSDVSSRLMPASLHFAPATLAVLAGQYSRNNRGNGLKNLKCFPACRSDGHRERAFCGRELVVHAKSECERWRPPPQKPPPSCCRLPKHSCPLDRPSPRVTMTATYSNISFLWTVDNPSQKPSAYTVIMQFRDNDGDNRALCRVGDTLPKRKVLVRCAKGRALRKTWDSTEDLFVGSCTSNQNESASSSKQVQDPTNRSPLVNGRGGERKSTRGVGAPSTHRTLTMLPPCVGR
jgi:hypothetical protein